MTPKTGTQQQPTTEVVNGYLILGTKADAGRLFSVHRSTIADWIDRGMPVRSDGRINATAALAWLACFGPERSETSRDQYLRNYIERLNNG